MFGNVIRYSLVGPLCYQGEFDSEEDFAYHWTYEVNCTVSVFRTTSDKQINMYYNGKRLSDYIYPNHKKHGSSSQCGPMHYNLIISNRVSI